MGPVLITVCSQRRIDLVLESGEVPPLKEHGLQPVRGDSCFILSGASSLLLFLIFKVIHSLILLRIGSQIPLKQRNLNTVELIISPANLLGHVPFLRIIVPLTLCPHQKLGPSPLLRSVTLNIHLSSSSWWFPLCGSPSPPPSLSTCHHLVSHSCHFPWKFLHRLFPLSRNHLPEGQESLER